MGSIDKIKELFDKFSQTKVLVLGDVMLDTYIWGNVERISPEAPVPIVSVKKRESRLGGAANVALNLKELGATPYICSVISDDEKGREFSKLLKNAGLPETGIIKSKSRKTTVKFRIIGNNSQLLRVDDEITSPLNDEDSVNLKAVIKDIMENKGIDVIVFQDYDKGVITPSIIEFVTESANKKGIPTAVDPKKKNFLNFKNVTLFKPNLKEIQDGLNITVNPGNLKSIEKSVVLLQDKLNTKIVMNTLSEHGVFTRWKEGDTFKTSHQKAHIRNIADVSGAGDTVISLAALGLAAELPPDKITALANLAGGLVCEEVGVVPVNKKRLEKEILKSEILDL